MKLFLGIFLIFLMPGLVSATKYTVVVPYDFGQELPEETLIWRTRLGQKDKALTFLICDDGANSRLRSAHGVFHFSNVETCEKMQVMLRLSSPQCPLQLNVDDQTHQVNSFRLECDKLKL